MELMLSVVAIILSTLSLSSSFFAIVYLLKFNKSLVEVKNSIEQLKLRPCQLNSPPVMIITDPDINKSYTLFVKKDDLYLKEI